MKPFLTCFVAAVLIGVAVVETRGQSLSWYSISGVPGCVIVKEGGDGKLFAASDGRGAYNGVLYNSTDDGQSWYPTAITYGWILEVSANREHVVCSRYLTNARFPYQVFLSEDNGVTWKGIMSSDIFFNPYSGFMYSDQGNLFAVAGLNNSQLVKLNGQVWELIGTTFPRVSFTPGSQQPAPITPTAIDHDERMYVGTVANGLYMTSDYGSTWTQALAGLYVTAVAVQSPKRIVAGTSPNAVRNGGVFLSADTGRTWTFLGLAEEQITSLALDDPDGIYAATTKGVFRYGGTPNVWENISPSAEAYGGIEVNQTHSVFAAGTAKGVFRSVDSGKSWQRNGIPKEDIGSLLVTNGGLLVAGSYGNRVFVTSNDGGTWGQTFPGSMCDNVFALLQSPPRLFAGTNCGVYASLDDGKTWTDVSQQHFTGGAFALARDSRGSLYAGTNFGVYTSTDDGASWRQCGLGANKVTGLAASANDEIYALTGSSGVYRSTDFGQTWTSSGLVRNDLQTITINSSNTVFVGGDGGIYVSNDGGATWPFAPVTSAFVYALAFTDASTIIAGTGNGIFLSINGGASWTQHNVGLTQSIILSLGVSEQGYVYAGALHAGVFRSTQILTDVRVSSRVPTSFELHQNYPNPFNPATSIEYTTSKDGWVSLRIYDVIGNQVATLVDEAKGPGTYTVRWDARDVANGVYFYRMTAGKFSDVKKMLLLK